MGIFQRDDRPGYNHGYRLFSGKPPERQILTPETAAVVFRAEWQDERARLASLLSAVTGLRAGEIRFTASGHRPGLLMYLPLLERKGQTQNHKKQRAPDCRSSLPRPYSRHGKSCDEKSVRGRYGQLYILGGKDPGKADGKPLVLKWPSGRIAKERHGQGRRKSLHLPRLAVVDPFLHILEDKGLDFDNLEDDEKKEWARSYFVQALYKTVINIQNVSFLNDILEIFIKRCCEYLDEHCGPLRMRTNVKKYYALMETERERLEKYFDDGISSGLKKHSEIQISMVISRKDKLSGHYLVFVHKVGYFVDKPCIFSPKGCENAVFKEVCP
jgi:hypothetical protein